MPAANASRRAQRAPRAPLVVEWSAGGRRHRRSVTSNVRVGRLPENDIVLDSGNVSRHHCILRPTVGGLEVEVDASMSTNGVIAGGHRVQHAVIPPGGRFVVGDIEFTVDRSRSAGGGAVAPGPGRGANRALVPVLAGAGLFAVVLASIIAIVALGGSSPSTGAAHAGILPVVDGPMRTVQPYSETWIQHDDPRGFSFRVPEGWSTAKTPDGSVLVTPPESNGAAEASRIGLWVDTSHPYDGANSVRHHVTPPVPIVVNGVTGRAYKDAEQAVPFSGYTVELPIAGGTLMVFAATGPVVNLRPQLEELLKGLTVRS